MPAERNPLPIRSLEVEPLDIPLLEPFGISQGSLETAANVLVAVEAEGGARGYGEAAPFPAYDGATQAAALAALRAAAPGLVGRDARRWREGPAAPGRGGAALGGCALCALEAALLDLVARVDGVPLWRHFGGAGTTLETDMTITTGSREAAAAAARSIRARGIRVIKAKIGGPAGIEADLGRIGAIAEAAPGSPLVLDGNAGLSRSGAAQLVAGLRSLGITPLLLEQWLARDDLDGMRALHEETGWTTAADESVRTAADVRTVAGRRAAQVVNIKLMKAGIAEALAVAAEAKAAGLGLMIGGNVESILSMTVSACFAAGLGGFGYADLDTPLFLAENPFEGGFVMEGGTISVAAIAAGHGVRPRGVLL